MGKAKRKAGEPETIKKEEYEKRIADGKYSILCGLLIGCPTLGIPKYYKNHAAIIEVGVKQPDKTDKKRIFKDGEIPDGSSNYITEKVIVTGWYPLTIQSEKIHYSTH